MGYELGIGIYHDVLFFFYSSLLFLSSLSLVQFTLLLAHFFRSSVGSFKFDSNGLLWL